MVLKVLINTYVSWPTDIIKQIKKTKSHKLFKVSGNKSIGLNIYSDSIIDKGMVLSKRGNTTGKSAFWTIFKKQKSA